MQPFLILPGKISHNIPSEMNRSPIQQWKRTELNEKDMPVIPGWRPRVGRGNIPSSRESVCVDKGERIEPSVAR